MATTLARPVVKWKILFYSTKNISGDYTCEASNGVGLAQSYSIQLKVYAQPYFIKEPESQTAAEGETVTFECEAGGYPAPQVTYRPKIFLCTKIFPVTNNISHLKQDNLCSK